MPKMIHSKYGYEPPEYVKADAHAHRLPIQVHKLQKSEENHEVE